VTRYFVKSQENFYGLVCGFLIGAGNTKIGFIMRIAGSVIKRQQKWQDFAMVMFSGDRQKHYAYRSFYIGIDNVRIASQN